MAIRCLNVRAHNDAKLPRTRTSKKYCPVSFGCWQISLNFVEVTTNSPEFRSTIALFVGHWSLMAGGMPYALNCNRLHSMSAWKKGNRKQILSITSVVLASRSIKHGICKGARLRHNMYYMSRNFHFHTLENRIVKIAIRVYVAHTMCLIGVSDLQAGALYSVPDREARLLHNVIWDNQSNSLEDILILLKTPATKDVQTIMIGEKQYKDDKLQTTKRALKNHEAAEIHYYVSPSFRASKFEVYGAH